MENSWSYKHQRWSIRLKYSTNIIGIKIQITKITNNCYCLKRKPRIMPYVHHQACQPILAHHSPQLCYQCFLQAKLDQHTFAIHSFLNFYSTLHKSIMTVNSYIFIYLPNNDKIKPKEYRYNQKKFNFWPTIVVLVNFQQKLHTLNCKQMQNLYKVYLSHYWIHTTIFTAHFKIHL